MSVFSPGYLGIVGGKDVGELLVIVETTNLLLFPRTCSASGIK